MASAGVLMVAHGAAALNTIFQQQRSVLMEVFPYKRRRFGFMAAAQVAGQFYMPLFPHTKSWTGKTVMNETKFIEACDHISGGCLWQAAWCGPGHLHGPTLPFAESPGGADCGVAPARSHAFALFSARVTVGPASSHTCQPLCLLRARDSVLSLAAVPPPPLRY